MYINFSASSSSVRSPSTGNVWNISTSTRIPQTCHSNCDNWQTKRGPTQKWNVPDGSRCFAETSILMARALPIISHLAGCDAELQDEDDRQRAFVPHGCHPAVPERAQSSDTTRCKRRIKRVRREGRSRSPCARASTQSRGMMSLPNPAKHTCE